MNGNIIKRFVIAIILLAIIIAIVSMILFAFGVEGYTIEMDEPIGEANFRKILYNCPDDMVIYPDLHGVYDDGKCALYIKSFSYTPKKATITGVKVIDFKTKATVVNSNVVANIKTKTSDDEDCCFGYVFYEYIEISNEYLIDGRKLSIQVSINSDSCPNDREEEYVFHVKKYNSIALPT